MPRSHTRVNAICMSAVCPTLDVEKTEGFVVYFNGPSLTVAQQALDFLVGLDVAHRKRRYAFGLLLLLERFGGGDRSFAFGRNGRAATGR